MAVAIALQNIPEGTAIGPGKDADVVVFDPAAPRPYGVATSFMNVDYDLFEGQTLAGSPRTTLSRGTVVFDDGKILTKPGHGRFTKRATFDAATHGDAALRETQVA